VPRPLVPARVRRQVRGVLARLMDTTVTIEPFVRPGGFGGGTYGAPATYPAHVTYRTAMVRTADGQERASRGQVLLMPDIDRVPTTSDRLTIARPDGTTERPPILSVTMDVSDDPFAPVVVAF
jgi:hypothetical protein